MPRHQRQFSAGEYFHVISRGNNRSNIFNFNSDYRTFLELLYIFSIEYDVSIFHYVLMPNHIHLLLRPNNEMGSKFMQKVKSVYAVRYLKKYGKVGHLWQGRFKSILITNDAYLLACGNYIEMNPVRAGLVQNPEDWRFSSVHHYASEAKDRIISTSPLHETANVMLRDRNHAYLKQLTLTRSTKKGSDPF